MFRKAPDEEELALSWLKKRASELIKNPQLFPVRYGSEAKPSELKPNMENLHDICLVADRIVSVSKTTERDNLCKEICAQIFQNSEPGDIGAALTHLQIGNPTFRGTLGWRDRNKTATAILTARIDEIKKTHSSIDKYVCCTLLKMPDVNSESAYKVSTLVTEAKNYGKVELVRDQTAAQAWLDSLKKIYPAHSALEVALQIVYNYNGDNNIISNPIDIEKWHLALQENGYQNNDPYRLLELAKIFKEPNLISRWKQAASKNGLDDSIKTAIELATCPFTCPEDVFALREILKQNGLSDTLEDAKKLAVAFEDLHRRSSQSIQSLANEWVAWIKQNNGTIDDLLNIIKVFNRTPNVSQAMSNEWIKAWEKFTEQKFNLNNNTIQELNEFIDLTRKEQIKQSQATGFFSLDPTRLTEEQGINIARQLKLTSLIKSLSSSQRGEWMQLPGCTIDSGSTYRAKIFYLEEDRIKEWFQTASLFNKFSHEDVIAFAREEIKKGNQDPKSIAAVTIFFQDYPHQEGSYWNAERRLHATLPNIVDHAVGYTNPYMSIAGGPTLGRLMGTFGVTKEALEKKDFNAIADSIIRTNEVHNYARLSLKK